jgi:two-component system response regulator NreC
VLIHTAHDNEEYFFQTLKAGAVGYVLKKAAASDLIAAIEAASQGEPYLYPSVARLLVSDYLQRAPERETFEPLSDREREVLRLVAEGKTNRQIADTLFLSIKTVQTHRDHIMKKLHMHDRTELVKYAIRKGLIEADS